MTRCRQTAALLCLALGVLAIPMASAARAPRPAIPSEFRGLWTSTGVCSPNPDDSLLTLSAHQVMYYASGGPVRGVRWLGPRTVRLTVDVTSGEGELGVEGPPVVDRQRMTFRLSADGRQLTNLTTSPDDTKTRCP